MLPQGLIGARRLRELFEQHGIRPTRSLGQNFVIDPNTIRKMIEISGTRAGDHVLEIGAGGGSLTLGLAAIADKVTAIELDRKLLPVLETTLSDVTNVEIVEADALDVDLGSFPANRLVANLPYNIATPVVVEVLRRAPRIESLTVMTQREAGERLVAGPRSKTYGHVSVVVAQYASARIAARVSRRAFFPVPRVDSVIVDLRRKAGVDAAESDRLFALTRAAFAQRRKTLRNALAALAGSEASAAAALERAGISPGARAEEVGLEGFVALARELAP